jgi:predicted permease
MDVLIQDARHALRGLRRSPGFTVVALLTLALGIGANAAIFSLVNAVILRPMPFHDPDRLVMVWNHWKTFDIRQGPLSGPDFVERRANTTTLARLGGYYTTGVNLTGAGEPERVTATRVSHDVLPVLGVPPALGRGFEAAEDSPGRGSVVVLGHGLWKRRFGADAEILGKTVHLDGHPHTVVGVMPPRFRFPNDQTALWIPLALSARQTAPEQRGNEFLYAVGRLAPGATLERLRAELDAQAQRTLGDLPSFFQDNGWGATATLAAEEARLPYRNGLLLLLAAVGFVLLIACVNVAHLMLARAAARQREFAIRAALGAGRGRLARQLLTESLLLALAGGALGLLLASWSADALAALKVAGLPSGSRPAFDLPVAGFTLAISVLTGLLFGLVPALGGQTGRLADTLKETSTSHTGSGRRRLRSILVGAEVALTVLLLAGAGLALQSLLRLRQVKPGFDGERVLALRTALPTTRYATGESQAAFFERACERLASLPGVEAAGAVTALPLTGAGWTMGVRSPSSPATPAGTTLLTSVRTVAGDYFGAMGIPILRGEGISASGRAGAASEALVDDRFARTMWPNLDPLGRQVVFGDGSTVTIVGVVGSIREERLESDSRMMLYLPTAAAPLPTLAVVLRTSGAPADMAAAAREALWSLDRELPVFEVSPLAQVVSGSVASPRARALLLGLFAALALGLAAVGIYGLASYAAGQRTHEIGVRMALGARPADVLRLMIGQGMRPVAAGLLAGLALALILGRVVATQLYGVSPTDPLTFAAVPAILALVALLANGIPAWRAARVDPVVALRHE